MSARLVAAFVIIVLARLTSVHAAALDFAPTSGSPGNAYVTFGNTAALGLPTFTLEVWFNRRGAGVAASTGGNGVTVVPLVSKGASEADGTTVDANYVLGISPTGDVIAADFEEGPGGPGPLGNNHPIVGVTPIQNNTWYHAAATYDGTTWQLYLNGELEAQLTVGAPTRSDNTQHAGLATMLNSTGSPTGFFDGRIDEARIWNTARTATQIRATLDVQNPSDPTLVARWGLDEGTGTAVADSAGTPQNGTIVGTNFSWTSSAPFDVAPCANATNGMLRFDGTNDYVTFGNPAELGLTSFTIETWFKREGVGVGNSTGTGGITSLVPLVAKGAPEADGSNVDANYILGINTSGNVLGADFEEGASPSPSPGLNHPISGTTAITDNNWHHAAATFDSTTRDFRLYLDGVLEASATLAANVVPRFNSIQPAGLGTMQTSAPAPLGFFAGLLDEARIWNVARSQAQIQASRFQQLTSGTGLVARWGLGEGSGTTIADSVAPGSTGTLTSGPTWTASHSLFDATGTCNDGAFCTGADTCNGSQLRCAVHAGDPCLGGPECNNVCNEALDNCATAAATPCTNDGNVCTDDRCNGAGACTHPNNTAPCNDGSACTTVDVCAAGACVGSTPPDCDDGNGCTNDGCNPGSGCTHTANTAPCDDANACTTGDTCGGGSCIPGGPRDCSDGNLCTDDACNPGSGCVNTNNTLACNDGDACTTSDSCSGGVCVGGPPLDCNDLNVCTTDSCTPASGCQHAANAAPCSDGNACTVSDTCSGGTCGSGPAASCDDSNACTTDSCNPTSGCVHTAIPSCCNTNPECADSDQCTTNERCVGHACVSDAVACNDGNLCTDDSCNPLVGCLNVFNNAACNDGNLCTTGDACNAGVCIGGPPSNCDDGNPCTTDACTAGGGCTHTNNATPCDDGRFCTVNDTCSGGACTGSARDCSAAGDQCHTGMCDENLDQCVGPLKPNGSACDDGNACTAGETCASGTCTAGVPVTCGACETCEANTGCQPGPRPSCHGPVLPLKGKLQIDDRVPNAGDLVSWKLMKGEVTAISELRDPTMANSYTLCIFDQGGGHLALAAEAPAGGACGTGPCWKPISTIGYKYNDKERTPDGIAKVLLRASTISGGTKVHVKAKGDNIPPFSLPLTVPVVAQLQSTNGPCWKTTHTNIGVLRNDPKQFLARDD